MTASWPPGVEGLGAFGSSEATGMVGVRPSAVGEGVVDGVADDGEWKEEDFVDGGAGVERVRGAGEGVLGDEVVEKGAGARGGLGGEGDLAGRRR